MNRKSLTFLIAVICMFLASCGKSDQEKAEEFVKTLNKDAEVLFVLPDSMPKCVFYAENNIIKCHNVETDSTSTIPYDEDIDEDRISEVLPGKKSIMVITQDYDDIDGAYAYDLAKGTFSHIKEPGEGMKISDAKLSKSGKTITFTCDTTAEAPFVFLMCMFDRSLDYDTEKARTGYYRTVNTYNFDGKLVKSKRIPVSNAEWEEMEKAEKQEENSSSPFSSSSFSSSSSPAVYLWRCMKCNEEMEGVEEPSTYGCPYSGHMWQKVSRIR